MKISKIAVERILTVTLAFSVAATAAICPVYAADNIDTMQSKQSELASQQDANNSSLASLRQNKDQKTAYASTLQSQISTIEEQVNNYNNQITDLDLQAQKAEDAIAKTQKLISADNVKLKQRLCALYMGGEASNLQILLSSNNLLDLADKSEAVTMVTQHDTDLIDRLKSEKTVVQQKKAAIQQKRQEVESLKTTVSSKQQQLTDTLSETNQFLQEIGQQEIDLENKNSTLDAQTAKLSAAISSWSQQQVKKPTQSSSQSSQSDSQQPDTSTSASNNNSNNSSSDADSGSNSNSNSNSNSSSSFSSVIGKAESALGKPYVMGAAGPDAFDCSGLVCWAFGIPRTTAQGLCSECSSVSVSDRDRKSVV